MSVFVNSVMRYIKQIVSDTFHQLTAVNQEVEYAPVAESIVGQSEQAVESDEDSVASVYYDASSKRRPLAKWKRRQAKAVNPEKKSLKAMRDMFFKPLPIQCAETITPSTQSTSAVKLKTASVPRLVRGIQESQARAGSLDNAVKPQYLGERCNLMAVKPVPREKFHLKRDKIPLKVNELVDFLRLTFPEARFFLTGSGPINLVEGIKPNDYDIVIVNASISEINDSLRSHGIYSQIRSQKYPVIYCDLGDGLSVDFTVKTQIKGEPLKEILRADSRSRDFNINALYLQFGDEKCSPVFGFDDTLHTVRIGFIKPIQPLDAVRLIRLAKLRITNPEYTLDCGLEKKILGLTSLIRLPDRMHLTPKSIYFMECFVSTDKGNNDRLNGAFRKLFMRYDCVDIINAFQSLHILTAYTNNSYSSAKSACSMIPDVAPENKYICWLVANVIQCFRNGKGVTQSPLHSVYKLTDFESEFMEYVHAQLAVDTPQDIAGAGYLNTLWGNFSAWSMSQCSNLA